MKLNALILAAALAGASAGAAFAQGAAPPPQEARDALQKACAADLASLCGGKSGRDAAECLRAAGDKVSPDCKVAMTKMVRPGGGGGDAAAGPRAGGPPPAGTPVAPGSTWTLEVREDWLVGRLRRAQDEHDIDDAEAQRVFMELASMRDRAKQITVRRNRALTAGEMSAQLGRLDTLVTSIHWLNPNAFQRPW